MQQRSVRELSGEIWAEINSRIVRDVSPFVKFTDSEDLLGACIDLISGVLARYDGFLIVNDEDLPVDPLPHIDRELENEL